MNTEGVFLPNTINAARAAVESVKTAINDVIPAFIPSVAANAVASATENIRKFADTIRSGVAIPVKAEGSKSNACAANRQSTVNCVNVTNKSLPTATINVIVVADRIKIANNPDIIANNPVAVTSKAAKIATKGVSVASNNAAGAISPENIPFNDDIDDATCAGNVVNACNVGTNICIAIEKINDIGANTTITAISPAIVPVNTKAATITPINAPIRGRREVDSNSRLGTIPVITGERAENDCVIIVVDIAISNIDAGNETKSPDNIANITLTNISTTDRAVIVAVKINVVAIRIVKTAVSGVRAAARAKAGARIDINIPDSGIRAVAVSIAVCDNIISSAFIIIS